MPIERQTVTLSFKSGLDTKSDPRQTPAAKLQRLENAAFTRPGALQKVFGNTALSQTIANPSGIATTITEGLGLAAFRDELCLFDPARMYSYDAGTQKWIDKGPMISGVVAQTPVVRNIYGQTYQDGATHASGLQLYAWEDTSGGVRYSITDATTGQTVVASTLVSATAKKPKTLAIGSFLVLWFLDVADPAVPRLKVATIPFTNPTRALTPVTITGGSGSGFRQINPAVPSYDACIVYGANLGVADQMYLAFYNGATVAGRSVYQFLIPNLTNPAGMFTDDEFEPDVINIFGDPAVAGPVVCSWSVDTGTVTTTAFARFVPGLTQTALHSNNGLVFEDVVSITGTTSAPTTAGTWRIAFGLWDPATVTYDALTWIEKVTAYSFSAPTVLLRSVAPAAKAFAYKGLAYFPLAYESPLGSTYFLADENGNLVLRALAGLAGPFPRGEVDLGSALLPEVMPIGWVGATPTTAGTPATDSIVVSGTIGGLVGCQIGGNEVLVPSSQLVGFGLSGSVTLAAITRYWQTSDTATFTALDATLNANGTFNAVLTASLGSFVAVTPGAAANSISIDPVGLAVTVQQTTIGTDATFSTGQIFVSGSVNGGAITITGGTFTTVHATGGATDAITASNIADALALEPTVTSQFVIGYSGGTTITLYEMTGGNISIALGSSGTGITTDPFITGGADAIAAAWDYGYTNTRILTDADVATALVPAINTNIGTSALALASLDGTTVDLAATFDGSGGDAITLVAVGAGMTATTPTFAGGAAPVFADDAWDWPSVRWAALVRDFLTTLPATTATGTPTTATYTQTGVTALAWTFYDVTRSYQSATLAESLNIGGGFLTQYDGVAPVELGFHVSPELRAADIETHDTGGHLGSATQATTYWWAVTYEWTDAAGIVHVSDPSVPIEKDFISGVDTGHAEITIPTLRLTAKQGASPVTINVYRTIGTSPGIFYLAVTTIVPAPTDTVNQSIINDVTLDTVKFVDELSDADIIGNPRLYTTGGVLENNAPPPCNTMVVWQNRLFGIDAENPLVLFYSQQVTPGLPVSFSGFLTINLDPLIGGATALAVMDEKLVVYGAESTWYIIGQGPTNIGTGDSYQDPQLVPGEAVGCVNPRSTVLVDAGVISQSSKGLYLFSRGLANSYAGAEVEQLVAGRVVTSARAIPSTTQTRFTTDGGYAVVYDSLVGQWGSDTTIQAVAAVVWNGAYAQLRASGQVRVETHDTYLNGGAPIAVALTTAPIRLAGMAGFQRARLLEILGTYESPCDLDVSIMFDGNPAAVQTVTVSPSTPETWGSDPTWGAGAVWGGTFVPAIWRVYLNVQKCESVQVSIREVPSATSPGGGVRLSSLTFEIGAKKGAYKLPATSTYGG